jgi:hypothetical protein
MSTQHIPPFTREALALLFDRDNFQAFQKPGFPSHYWAPLLAACCGATRNEVFFLFPDDLVMRKDLLQLRFRRVGTEDAPVREVPLHPWLQQLGFVTFVEERQKTTPKERLFAEYKAGRENAALLFSRAFVQWIKTTQVQLPVEQQPLFAEDFHFPSLRALFWLEVERASVSESTLQMLHGGQGDPDQASTEMARIAIDACFPPLPPYAVLQAEIAQ